MDNRYSDQLLRNLLTDNNANETNSVKSAKKASRNKSGKPRAAQQRVRYRKVRVMTKQTPTMTVSQSSQTDVESTDVTEVVPLADQFKGVANCAQQRLRLQLLSKNRDLQLDLQQQQKQLITNLHTLENMQVDSPSTDDVMSPMSGIDTTPTLPHQSSVDDAMSVISQDIYSPTSIESRRTSQMSDNDLKLQVSSPVSSSSSYSSANQSYVNANHHFNQLNGSPTQVNGTNSLTGVLNYANAEQMLPLVKSNSGNNTGVLQSIQSILKTNTFPNQVPSLPMASINNNNNQNQMQQVQLLLNQVVALLNHRQQQTPVQNTSPFVTVPNIVGNQVYDQVGLSVPLQLPFQQQNVGFSISQLQPTSNSNSFPQVHVNTSANSMQTPASVQNGFVPSSPIMAQGALTPISANETNSILNANLPMVSSQTVAQSIQDLQCEEALTQAQTLISSSWDLL